MQFKSISFRIYFWLLVFSVLPLVIMTELFLFSFEKQTHQSEFAYLSSIADKKLMQIDTYFNERTNDIDTLVKNPIITNALGTINSSFDKQNLESKTYLRAELILRPYAERYIEKGYYDLFLISPEGDVIFTVKHEEDFSTNLNEGPYSSTSLAYVYRVAQAELKTSISTFEYYPPSKESAAFIASPIIKDGKLLGVLALQIDIDRVFDVVMDNIGLGETGETVIARDKNDAIDFIGPLKFSDLGGHNLTISRTTALALPMQKALDGEKGYGHSIDYRGADVVAVWRYLPLLEWGIVIKKDSEEAFSSVQDMREMRWLILIFIIIAVMLAASLIGRSIVQPIRDLTDAAKKISAGNLHQRVLAVSQDEVGQLATSFNHMTQELQKTHVELEKKAKEAESANLSKSEFLSRMSHELRTPMNAILGFAQMLELDIEGMNDIQKENIEEILMAGRHLLSLINEVLDLARIESGKLEISMEEVLLDDVLKESIKLVTSQSDMRNISVIDTMSGKDFTIHADYTRIKQVLVNLLTNAVKYNREDGAILIDGMLVDENRLRINIKDTGCGLKEDEMDKLFTAFERLNAVDNVEGTGIGLVITKNLVELMGGNIGVSSVIDEGSVFWIEVALFKGVRGVK